ncbi:MAG: amidase family protein [candidate division NC10 bacterium]
MARCEDAPLLGLPLTLKESINVRGLRTTVGMPHWADFRSEHDAPVTGGPWSAAIDRMLARIQDTATREGRLPPDALLRGWAARDGKRAGVEQAETYRRLVLWEPK